MSPVFIESCLSSYLSHHYCAPRRSQQGPAEESTRRLFPPPLPSVTTVLQGQANSLALGLAAMLMEQPLQSGPVDPVRGIEVMAIGKHLEPEVGKDRCRPFSFRRSRPVTATAKDEKDRDCEVSQPGAIQIMESFFSASKNGLNATSAAQEIINPSCQRRLGSWVHIRRIPFLRFHHWPCRCRGTPSCGRSPLNGTDWPLGRIPGWARK